MISRMDLSILELEWGRKNNMAEKKIKDANGVEFELNKDDFTFVQKDEKIHDTKFETKPTTFAKDAFKRFCKNKSSVVASFIIGIIVIFSIFVPIFSNGNVSQNLPEQRYLEPKLFDAGTGFWDGTKNFKDIPYDVVDEVPVGFKKNAVVKITKKEDHFTNLPSNNSHGGSLKIVATQGSDIQYIYNYASFELNSEDSVELDIKFNNVDGLNGKIGKYQIFLSRSPSRTGTRYALTELKNSYEDLSINLSEFIASKSITNIPKAYIQIEIPQDQADEQYILINSLTLSSKSNNVELDDLLKEISIDDASAQCMIEPNTDLTFPNTYWRCSGRKEVYQAVLSKVSFVYDYYEAQLGLQENFRIGKSILEEYISKGWCSYDFEIGPSSFVKLSDKCPIEKIHSEIEFVSEYMQSTDYVCDVIMYKYKGYKSMPKFILGTDILGRDLFTFSLKALRTSLLLAVIVSAINFIIGLVWGSISGYFGGNIDLFMERFCDILGGVPFVVVITLTILVLGNNLGTFALALCLTGWMGTAARTRTQFYRFKGREYILAARTLGASDKRLIFKHILPNSMGTIITSVVLMIPGVIFSEASIAYLGLGLKGVDSFGVLLSNYQSTYSTHPMLIIFPSIIISLLMISFNLFGNGLRDALNPSLKGSE